MRDADTRIASDARGGNHNTERGGVGNASRADGARETRLDLPSDQDASGRSLGEAELVALRAVIESGTLTSTKGRYVKALEAGFASMLDVAHAVACASGTAAVGARSSSASMPAVASPICCPRVVPPIVSWRSGARSPSAPSKSAANSGE